MNEQAIRELRELSYIECLPLPLSPEAIALLEASGYIVDLRTGAIIVGGAALYIDSPALDPALAQKQAS